MFAAAAGSSPIPLAVELAAAAAAGAFILAMPRLALLMRSGARRLTASPQRGPAAAIRR
jgi:hypothetical protein